MIVRITYPQPSVWLDLWGGTSSTFNGLDQFNRVIDQRWTSASSVESQNSVTTTPTDIDRYQYGYDQNSNRRTKPTWWERRRSPRAWTSCTPTTR